MKSDAPLGAMWKVRDEVVHRQIGDLCVLLDLRSGAFYTLNETASLFWRFIEQGTPIEEMAACVTAQYDVCEDEVLQDVAGFVDFFSKERLLILQRLQGDSASAG